MFTQSDVTITFIMCAKNIFGKRKFAGKPACDEKTGQHLSYCLKGS